MCPTGLAILAIFYFHFGDTTKQDARNLLSTVLIQLCSQSDKFSQVLSSIYLSHGHGSREPSIDTLLECLKEILALQGQAPIYMVVDALDECPNSSGLRTQRQEVLEIMKELIDLNLPHLHFCVTSRPEIDILRAFNPLEPYNVSLHDQDGQIKDLAEYIKSVVGSDATMQDWPAKVKESVIDTLTKKAAGMYVILILMASIPFSCSDFRFRWAYCQLETLRQCPLRYISSTLDELPETLDETYERILQGIPKKMQKDAHHIFQWLTVSSRPLRVQEVAEVFAINFDEETSGIPNFEPSWRDPNAERAVLCACSTLVATVDNQWYGKIVQFSHFSVKEYLASGRIANSEHVSRFHIHPKLAHTLFAKACLSVLFQLDYSTDKAEIIKNFPLAGYAAEHWVEHARFEDVSSYIRDGMDLLFEKDKPHFAAWVRVYDMDQDSRGYFYISRPGHLHPGPFYYAALCGLRGLVERLLTAHPQCLNAESGVCKTPLNAALYRGHLNIALFLLERGADTEIVSWEGHTALYIASSQGYANAVRSLIDRGADPNAICEGFDEDWGYYGNEVKWTPLHEAIYNKHRDIAILLLECGAATEILSSLGQTALYMASSRGYADVVQSLIDHGADLNTKCQDCIEGDFDVKWAPLHAAINNGHRGTTLVLLEGGADTETRCNWDKTALFMASSGECADTVRQLVIHGGDLHAECKSLDVNNNIVEMTPLHEALCTENLPNAKVLLEHGANPNAPDKLGRTALHVTTFRGGVTHVELLLENGAEVDVRDELGRTPLHEAAYYRDLPVVAVLLNWGANPHAQTYNGETPIQLANGPRSWVSREEDRAQTIRLLSERIGEGM